MRMKAVLIFAIFTTIAFVFPDTADARRRRRRHRRRAPVAASQRVVVLPFSGPNAAKIRTQIVRGMRRRVRPISYAKYRRVAEQLKVEERTAVGITTVCAQLKCHAVIAGQVDMGRRNRYVVTVTVFNANDGEALGDVKTRARGRRRVMRNAKRLGRGVARLARRGSIPAAAAAPAPAPEPEPTAAPGDVTSAEQVVEEIPPFAADGEVPGGLNSAEDGESEESGGSALKLNGIFDVYAAVGYSVRNFKLSGADPEQNREYSGDYPEFVIGAEVYPAAFFMDNFARNIGLSFNYARHITVSTDLPDNPSRPATCDLDEDVDTSSHQLLVDLKLRWPIDLSWKPVFQSTLGWGTRSFDLGQNDVLPGFTYQFMRFGISGRVPLGTPLAALEVGGDARMVLKVGQEAIDSLGERSGGFGWSVYAGVRGDLPFGLFYFGTFEYQSYSNDYDGLDTAEYAVRECYPDREDATTGKDSYIRMWLGVGYAM